MKHQVGSGQREVAEMINKDNGTFVVLLGKLALQLHIESHFS